MPAAGQILTAAQMRDAEAKLIAAGDTVETLMERAGCGAADYVFRIAAARKVTVLCGPGNNGGDGYVIARALYERGVPVVVVGPLEARTVAAQAARALYRGGFAESARGAVLVDCLFGTGLARPLDMALAGLLNDLAAAHPLRIAVDLPSGVDSDSGALLNDGLPDYALTLALGAWKRAHWLGPANARMGKRQLVDIGCAPVGDAAQLASPVKLSAPKHDAHKYTRGLLAVVGGEMPGAAMLAARSAQLGGAGYVKLVGEGAEIATSADLVAERGPLAVALVDPRIAALLIGPGLGRGDAAREALLAALAFAGPLVLDADALMLLEPPMLAERAASLIVTPHGGELAALASAFGLSQLARPELAQALAEALNATVIAKGPDTLIVSPREPLWVMPPASPWLSTAGTGDVLAGLVASRLATGSPPVMAAREACQLHAEAARLAGAAFSANDLIDNIPAAYKSFL